MSDRLPPDDDTSSGRQRDQAEASESRLRKLVMRILSESRDEFWLRQGFDLSSESGREKLVRTLGFPASIGVDVMDKDALKSVREMLPWGIRAQKRAGEFGKRLLVWITTGIGIAGGLMGIAKYLQDWRGH